ncbi:MAG: branched-chain amino acid ABC transporter permease [Clostridia bacterium]|jgi:branched-chain amino acid transport system permease protein|nr:branched-chain amino acid ABC transporter permease [Clostridia bacterium]
MSEVILQVVGSGVLWGFIFVLSALGLTIIFGVMDICNFAHGDFLMMAMFLAFWLSVWPGLDPMLSLPIVAIAIALLGVATYWLLIRHVLKASGMAQIFVTFGLMIFLRGLAQALWGADYRSITDPLVQGSWNIMPNLSLSKPQVVAALCAIVATILVYLFMTKTRTGLALQAVSEDKDAASLMGIPVQKMYILAWIIGAGCVGIAGGLLSEFYYIYPEVGMVYGFLAFITVALGGFGSIKGVFYAGLIIGMVQALGGFFFGSAYQYLLVYGLYFVCVVVRPQGLMGRR